MISGTVQVPSLGAIFKAIFLASAVVVIAGVTYIAADKAIAGIQGGYSQEKESSRSLQSCTPDEGLAHWGRNVEERGRVASSSQR